MTSSDDNVGVTGFEESALDRLVVSPKAPPVLVEQFRSLAATLHQAQKERHFKSVVVTSPAPGDGKSHVAINLALTLAASYRRKVLLIDGDLRRPTLHSLFEVAGTKGLSDALSGDGDGSEHEVRVIETLSLLPAGGPVTNPVGDLSSGRMERLVASAVTRFDWVIIDSPPAGGLADARIISETVDATLLVVRAGVTRYSDLEAAVDGLGHDRILGVVLNALDPLDIQSDSYYSHYYR